MKLIDIRQEVLNHGFDPINFSPARLTQYINDGLYLICRRVNYYAEETQISFSTTAGLANYGLIAGGGIAGPQGTLEALPTAVGRIKSMYDPVRNVELEEVGERDIDRSSTAQGTPNFYALGAGGNLVLYPTPDNAYSLLVRVWLLPQALTNDSDIPKLPQDWHHILWVYACWMCYEAEDDASMGQYWKQRFQEELAEFAADQRFPSSDYPTQLTSMWEQDRQLSNSGWSLYWGY